MEVVKRGKGRPKISREVAENIVKEVEKNKKEAQVTNKRTLKG